MFLCVNFETFHILSTSVNRNCCCVSAPWGTLLCNFLKAGLRLVASILVIVFHLFLLVLCSALCDSQQNSFFFFLNIKFRGKDTHFSPYMDVPYSFFNVLSTDVSKWGQNSDFKCSFNSFLRSYM